MYDAGWILGLFIVVGLFGRLFKDRLIFDNFITDVLSWFATDGTAIFVAILVIPPAYVTL
jgi:hypothetical protein